MADSLKRALDMLNTHYDTFTAAVKYAKETGHPVPSDTRGWSQVLVSVLTGLKGRGREKGTDFEDGSDVKGANTWEAIDTPRFNGVLKAGTKAESAGKLASLDNMPYLFFVLWDTSQKTNLPRCRVWVVRPQSDKAFRGVCEAWYGNRDAGSIKSDNFQLHPPRGKDTNEIRNKCGNLEYPLLLWAEREAEGYKVIKYHPKALKEGACAACAAPAPAVVGDMAAEEIVEKVPRKVVRLGRLKRLKERMAAARAGRRSRRE